MKIKYQLRLYRVLKIKLANQYEQKNEGHLNIFPIIRNSDELTIKIVHKIEKGLNSLTRDESDLIKIKYLSQDILTDYEVCQILNIKKDKYYKLKKSAEVKLK